MPITKSFSILTRLYCVVWSKCRRPFSICNMWFKLWKDFCGNGNLIPALLMLSNPTTGCISPHHAFDQPPTQGLRPRLSGRWTRRWMTWWPFCAHWARKKSTSPAAVPSGFLHHPGHYCPLTSCTFPGYPIRYPVSIASQLGVGALKLSSMLEYWLDWYCSGHMEATTAAGSRVQQSCFMY